MTFFSVVIPTYNRSRSLRSTVASVLCQTFSSFEILVIDDGSTDDTREVVKLLSDKDPRIKYFYQDNSERGAARNLGIKKSKGAWICFLDSDDHFLPHHLEYLKQAVSQCSDSIIASRYSFQPGSECSSSAISAIPSGPVPFSYLINGNPFACNFSIRNNASDTFYFPEDRGLATMEDWLFLVDNHSTHGLFLLDKPSVLMTDHSGRSMYNHQQVISARLHALCYLNTSTTISSCTLLQMTYGTYYFCSIHYHLSSARLKSLLYFFRSIKLDIPLHRKLLHLVRIILGPTLVRAFRRHLRTNSSAPLPRVTHSSHAKPAESFTQLSPHPLRVHCYSLYDSLAASHRVRISQYQNLLSLHRINLDIQSLLSNNYLRRSFNGQRPNLLEIIRCYLARVYFILTSRSSDTALIYCELFPFVPAWIEGLFLPKKYIYDLDDAFFLKYFQNRPPLFRYLFGTKIDKLISRATCITAGNEFLYDYCSKLNDSVFLLPSCVDMSRYVARRYSDDTITSPFTIGWIGTPSTVQYLLPILPVIQRLSLEYNIRLIVVGAKLPTSPDFPVLEQDWSYSNEIDLIHQFDVGIMPLPSTSWARGKCSYKLIQCMACAVPVIASAVGANQAVVDPSSGFLANKPSDWLNALIFFITNPHQRQLMGLQARRTVRDSYSVDSCYPTLLEAILTSIES